MLVSWNGKRIDAGIRDFDGYEWKLYLCMCNSITARIYYSDLNENHSLKNMKLNKSRSKMEFLYLCTQFLLLFPQLFINSIHSHKAKASIWQRSDRISILALLLRHEAWEEKSSECMKRIKNKYKITLKHISFSYIHVFALKKNFITPTCSPFFEFISYPRRKGCTGVCAIKNSEKT